MEKPRPEESKRPKRIRSTGGPPCEEAQADGVPCDELGRDCEDCENAEPERREDWARQD